MRVRHAVALAVLLSSVHGLFPTSHPMAWGSNAGGRTGLGTVTGNTLEPVNQFDTLKYSSGNIALASMGQDHGLALSTDGKVWAWGSNGKLQVGDDDDQVVADTAVEVDMPGGLTGSVVSVHAGEKVSLVLTSNDEVWAWGSSADRIPGVDTNTDQYIPQEIGGLNVAEMSVFADFVVARTTANPSKVVTWGRNTGGQCGRLGTTTPLRIPDQVDNVPGNALSVAAGGAFGLAAVLNGANTEVWGWGDNAQHQIGGATGSAVAPREVVFSSIRADDRVDRVYAGECHSAVITEPSLDVYTWGCNEFDQTGHSGGEVEEPQLLTFFNDAEVQILEVSLGSTFSLFLDTDGRMWSLGGCSSGQCGSSVTSVKLSEPTLLPDAPRFKASNFAESAGFNAVVAVTDDCPCVYQKEDADCAGECDCESGFTGEYCGLDKDSAGGGGLRAVLIAFGIGAGALLTFVVILGIVRATTPAAKESEHANLLFGAPKEGERNSLVRSTPAVKRNSSRASMKSSKKQRFMPDYEKLMMAHPSLTLSFSDLSSAPNLDGLATDLVHIFEANSASLVLLKTHINREVRAQPEFNNFMRGSGLLAKLLQAYGRLVGLDYIAKVLRPFTAAVESRKMVLDLDNKKSVKKFTGGIRSIVDAMLATINADMPIQFRQISNHMFKTCSKAYGGNKGRVAVGMFLFPRVFCAALGNPLGYGLVSKKLDKEGSATIALASRTLANIAAGVDFKEAQYADINKGTSTEKARMEQFVKVSSGLPRPSSSGSNTYKSLQSRGWVKPPAVAIPFRVLMHALMTTYSLNYANRREIMKLLESKGRKEYQSPRDLTTHLNTVYNKIGEPEDYVSKSGFHLQAL